MAKKIPNTLPSRKSLQRIERWAYPLSALVAVLLGGAILFQSAGKIYGLLWLVFGIPFVILVWRNVSEWPGLKVGDWIRSALGDQRAGMAAIIFSLVILIIDSYTRDGEVILVVHFWPVMVFVTILFAQQYKSNRLIFKHVMVALILLVGFVLFDAGLAAVTSSDVIAKYFEFYAVCLAGQNIIQVLTDCSYITTLWPAIWYIVTAFLATYFVHRHQLYRALDAANRGAINKTTAQFRTDTPSDLDSLIEQVLDSVHTIFRKAVVSYIGVHRTNQVWKHDSRKSASEKSPYASLELHVLSVRGTDKRANEIQPWRATTGLTGKLVRSEEEVLYAPDVRGTTYIKPEGAPDKIRSELAVAIRSGGTLFGILDISSEREDAFTDEDEEQLLALATPLSAGYLARFVDELCQASIMLGEELSKLQDEQKMVACFWEKISEQARVDIIRYYALFPATGYPKFPPFTFGKLRHKNHRESGEHGLGVVLEDVLQDWKPIYEQDAAKYRKIYFYGPNFVVRENIQSFACIPLSYGHTHLAVLFLNYQSRELFGTIRRLAITTLGQVLAHNIARIRQEEIEHWELAHTKFRLHATLSPVKLNIDFVEKNLEKFAAKMPEEAQAILDLDRRLVRSFEQEELNRWIFDNETYRNHRLPIIADLFSNNFCKIYRAEHPHIRIIPFIDPLIQFEPIELKRLIMVVVNEATINAIMHAKATRVRIELCRCQQEIVLRIGNNNLTGRTVKPDLFDDKNSETGITYLLNLIKSRLGGKFNWEVGDNQMDTRLEIIIPVRPSGRESDFLFADSII